MFIKECILIYKRIHNIIKNSSMLKTVVNFKVKLIIVKFYTIKSDNINVIFAICLKWLNIW